MDNYLYWSDRFVAGAEASKKMGIVPNPDYRGYSIAVDARDGVTHQFTFSSEGAPVKDRGMLQGIIPEDYCFVVVDPYGKPSNDVKTLDKFHALPDAMQHNVMAALRPPHAAKPQAVVSPSMPMC